MLLASFLSLCLSYRWNSQGPFDFLVGFSQGGILATLLTAFLEKPDCLEEFLATTSSSSGEYSSSVGSNGSERFNENARILADLKQASFGSQPWRCNYSSPIISFLNIQS